MPTPVIICASDLAHLPETRQVLASAGEVRYVSATPEALQAAMPDADAYYASLRVQLTGELMRLALRLRVIATPSTGLDHIDLETARERNIAVLSLKDDRELLDRITSTAELAWALLLACVRRLPEAIDASRRGEWARDRLRGHQLAGKTLGILGMGRLGTIMAEYGQAFRMRVIGCDIRPVQIAGVEQVSFDRLICESDVVSIHIHLNDRTRGLIGREQLASMKAGAVLINTSRGGIIDESALVDALYTGALAAAGLDVINGEWRDDLDRHPLVCYAREHGNLVITPHVGGVTYEAQELAYAAAARKLIEYLAKHAG